MSNVSTVGLMAAIGIGATFVFLYGDRWIHEQINAVATGVIRGIPVPLKHRQLLLVIAWFPLVSGVVVFDVLISLSFIAIAQNVSTDFIQALAYMFAVGFMFPGIIWIVLGTSWFLHLNALLRQAGAD